jgi:hypothetical protein
MKRFVKLTLVIALFVPIAIIGTIAYAIDEITDDWLERLGEWAEK